MLAGAGGRVQGPLRLVTKIIRLDSSWRVGLRWPRAKWRSKSGMDHDTENGVKASKDRFDLLSVLYFISPCPPCLVCFPSSECSVPTGMEAEGPQQLEGWC